MERVLDGVERVVSWFAAILFLAMVILVCVQVVYRYGINVLFVGSEEAARALMVYVVFLGAAIAVRAQTHLAITFFVDSFPARLRMVCVGIQFGCIIGISLLLAVKGFELSDRMMFQITPALQVSRGLLTAAFPIGGILMALFALELLVRTFRTGRPLEEPVRPGDSPNTSVAL